MKVEVTERGFGIAEFADSYGGKFSVQESSNVVPSLWVGPREPKIQKCEQGKGWSDVALPEGANVFSRGHLSRKMVKDVVTLMRRWLRTGVLEETTDDANNMAAKRLARLESEAKAAAWDRQSEWYQNACDGESPSDGRRERWIQEERKKRGLP